MTYSLPFCSIIDNTTNCGASALVKDGLLVKATPEDVKNTRQLEYGPVSDEDMQALKDAVDKELERLNE